LTLVGVAQLLIPHLLPDFVQAIVDALPTPIFLKDRDGVYQGCNKAFGRLYGKRRSEIIGKTVFDLSPRDFAQKHFEADAALLASGGEQRYEAQIQRPDGERRFVVFHKAALRDPDGCVCGIVGTILDITERKALEVQLADLADRDCLTGLLNRRAILACLEALHHDRRQSRQGLCLLMCDVDRFKAINDEHGHGVGDRVLQEVAQVLRANLREGDEVGRIGGEEFLVVLNSSDMDDASQIAERLRQLVAQIEVLGEGTTKVEVTMSIGLARSDVHDDHWSSTVARADQGLYAAKRTGRDRVVIADDPAWQPSLPFPTHDLQA
jgi:diguanylate cyclase (GGDEF)-like protein/PAS domain S-box-containing protein